VRRFTFCLFIFLLSSTFLSVNIVAFAASPPKDNLWVTLPDGAVVGPDPDIWLSEGWLLNVTGRGGDFVVRINGTGEFRASDIHLIIALNDFAYDNLVELRVGLYGAYTNISKADFQYGVPTPYNLWSWPDDVYPTWFNDTIINAGAIITFIDELSYKDVNVSVAFSDATCARMHFDAYGSLWCKDPTCPEQIIRNLDTKDSTVIFNQIPCEVTFLTDPVCSNFNITYQGSTYHDGATDTYDYGTSGQATANCALGYMFDHWEATGNVFVSNLNSNPTCVTIKCGGTLKAVCKRIQCQVTFLTDPVCSNFNITYQGSTYHDGATATFYYGTSGPALASCDCGYTFDHWEATGNVLVSDWTANPTCVTINCGGTLKAVCKIIPCDVTFLTDPTGSDFNITYQGSTYHSYDTDTFNYGTSGPASANFANGYSFDHWETAGNVLVSDLTSNPTNVTIKCGGSLKAVFKKIVCQVLFLTDPVCANFSITYQGSGWRNGTIGTFSNGTFGPAIAVCGIEFVFNHWETLGNVSVSNSTANPTNVTVTCGGALKAVFEHAPCQVTFLTDPVCSNFNITFQGSTYHNGTGGTFTYGTNGFAFANCSSGYAFDYWEADWNICVSNTTANPANVTIKCGGTLKAVFRRTACWADFTAQQHSPAVTFDASSSYDPDGYIVNYTWDFGDGNMTTTADPLVAYTYDGAGTYNVTLTVTDNECTSDSNTKSLTIVTLAADLNRDGIVNIVDVAIAGKAFGSKLGEPDWNETADTDRNGLINIVDIAFVAKNFGKTE
jgi:hypothetical protein